MLTSRAEGCSRLAATRFIFSFSVFKWLEYQGQHKYLPAPELRGAASFDSVKSEHSLVKKRSGVSGVNLRLDPGVRHYRFRLVRRLPAEPKEVFSD